MPHTILNLLDSLPSLIAQGGYWVMSIIVILEGAPIVGSLLPGHIAIVAAGFLAKMGILNLSFVIIVGSISAIIGDMIGFFAGRKYGYPLLTRFGKYLFIKETHIEKAKKLIDAHTGKSLIIGKFSPVTRPLTPFLVGASNASFKTFCFFNVVSAIIWITISVMIGYVFGASYSAASHVLGKWIGIAFIVTILTIWGYHFANKRFHIFKRYELFVLILNLLSLWGLAKTIQDAFSLQPFLINFDEWVSGFMLQHVSPTLTSLALFITNIGSTKVTISLGIIIGLGFLIKKKWRRGVIMLVSVLSTSVFVVFMKGIVERVRPENALNLYGMTDPSFPSGHAALAAAFFVALAYIFAPHINSSPSKLPLPRMSMSCDAMVKPTPSASRFCITSIFSCICDGSN
jgi:membrane protein DedA with SNARE-associated domain